MTVYVLDTDTLSLWQHGHAAVSQHVSARPVNELAITVITVQEQLDGWHSRLARAKDRKELADQYQRLAETVRFLSRVQILEFPEEAIERYEGLRAQKLNIGKMDLRIAAIALQFKCVLATRNT
jgi:tRNA(fMet)-specific endonuclease VapC